MLNFQAIEAGLSDRMKEATEVVSEETQDFVGEMASHIFQEKMNYNDVMEKKTSGEDESVIYNDEDRDVFLDDDTDTEDEELLVQEETEHPKVPIISNDITNETANSLISQVLDEGLDRDYALQAYTESIFKSDEDIFYNKNAFTKGDVNLCFIVGLAGSGKTHLAKQIKSDAHGEVEHYQLNAIVNNKSAGRDEGFYSNMGELAYDFFRGPGRRFYVDEKEIASKLNLNRKSYEEQITNAFVDFAVRYARSHPDTKYIIEGVQLHRYINPSRFRDFAVCIKGTSIGTSMYQSSQKKGSSMGQQAKRVFQYAADDIKLKNWVNMYKNASSPNDSSREFGDDREDDDEDYRESVIAIPVDTEDLLYMEAYNTYIENEIFQEERINRFVSSKLMTENADMLMVMQESKIGDWVKGKFARASNFLARIADRFIKAMERFLLSQRKYLEKYQAVILNTPWSDSMDYEYNGDYKEAVTRVENFPLPEFNFDVYAPFLRQDDYTKALERFTAGKNFKYDPGNSNLAEQFKNYFLALERGVSKGKFNQLDPKAIYKFCHDDYDALIALVKKDQMILKHAETAFQAAARRIDQEKAMDASKQSRENWSTRTQASAQGSSSGTPANDAKSASSSESNGGQTNSGAPQSHNNSYISPYTGAWLHEADPAPANGSGSGGSSGTNSNTGSSEVSISDKTGTTTNQNGQEQNQSGQSNTDTGVDDINNLVNKWVKMCSALCTGKYTAIQQISKDYMAIIRAHVKSHTKKDEEKEAEDASKITNDQQQTNNEEEKK